MTTKSATPLTTAIARILKTKRAVDLNMSQPELARRSAITQAQISRIEQGERTYITTDELDALCAALGLDPVTVLAEARAFVRSQAQSLGE